MTHVGSTCNDVSYGNLRWPYDPNALLMQLVAPNVLAPICHVYGAELIINIYHWSTFTVIKSQYFLHQETLCIFLQYYYAKRSPQIIRMSSETIQFDFHILCGPKQEKEETTSTIKWYYSMYYQWLISDDLLLIAAFIEFLYYPALLLHAFRKTKNLLKLKSIEKVEGMPMSRSGHKRAVYIEPSLPKWIKFIPEHSAVYDLQQWCLIIFAYSRNIFFSKNF